MPTKRSKRAKTRFTQPILVAIDPGCRGCAAAIAPTESDPILFRFAKDERQEFLLYLNDWRLDNLLVVMEHIWARQGIHSSGKMMEAYGFMQGALTALGIEYHSMTPKDWHKLAGVKFPDLTELPEKKRYTARKRHMVELASEAWPTMKGQITQDTADSLMMLKALQKWPLLNRTSS